MDAQNPITLVTADSQDLPVTLELCIHHPVELQHLLDGVHKEGKEDPVSCHFMSHKNAHPLGC
jgi:hypothetical protein